MASSREEEKSKLFRILEQTSWSYSKYKIPNLFTLEQAVEVLKRVRPHLDPNYCESGEADIDSFYDLLAETVRKNTEDGVILHKYSPILIVLEVGITFHSVSKIDSHGMYHIGY